MPLYREDTLERWCATEVDAEGVMVAVSLKLLLVLDQESKCSSIHVLVSRASGVIASLPVMKTSYWMVLSIAVCTAPVSTTMTTPGDSLVSVLMDSLRTAQTSVSGVCRGLTSLPTC